jgi:xeroderma pigmentosum group C-complementing protein
VLHGAVVAAEHEEAVRAVIEGLQDQEAEIEQERRTREVLRAWRRFLMNLRVRQRIWDGVDPEEEQANENDVENGDQGAEEMIVMDGPSEEPDAEAMPSEDSDAGGGFMIDDDYAGGFLVD